MSVDAGTLRIRPLHPGDDGFIRHLFRDTIAMGAPLPFAVRDMDVYERLCLDWYLGPGRETAAVLCLGEEICGYTLVCTSEAAFRRWSAPRAFAYGARVLAGLAAGRHSPESATFHRLRLRDGLATWGGRPPSPQPVHMHFNIARGRRAGLGGFRLAHYVDTLCQERGLPGWYGEINALVGRRAPGLARYGGEVVHSMPNRTLSWLAGRPVERLTVQRSLDPRRYRPLPVPA